MTDWLGTLLWLLTGTILLIVLRIYRSVTVDQISTNIQKHPLPFTDIPKFDWCRAVSSAILSTPLPEDAWWSPTNRYFVLRSGGFGSLSRSKTYQNSIKAKQLP